MTDVGFVGAGNIGGPMAQTLLRGHLNLKLCDFSESVRQQFRELGCQATDKASELAECEAIVFMVNTAEQLLDALFGPTGLVAGLGDGPRPLVIVTSTIFPAIIEDISAKLAESDVRMIDAPVSGGPIPAAQGDLTIMVGGDPADVEKAMPILQLLGSRVIVCGTLGAGQRVKIINNLVGITNQLLMAEALELANRCGLDGRCLLSAMDNSSGRNFWSRDWDLTRAQYAEYAQVADAGLYVERSTKDLSLALKLAGTVSVSMPLLEAAAIATGRMENRETSDRFRSFCGD